MLIRITALRDENRPIQAIKELRALAPQGSVMGLREAKDTIDAVRGLNGPRRSVEIEVADGTRVGALEWLVAEPVVLAKGIDRDLCLDFAIAAASHLSVHQARELFSTGAGLAFREALR